MVQKLKIEKTTCGGGNYFDGPRTESTRTSVVNIDLRHEDKRRKNAGTPYEVGQHIRSGFAKGWKVTGVLGG
jgi:hypothetical protein